MSAENMGRKSLAKVVLPLDDGPERPIMMVLLLAEDCPALLSDDISFLLLLSCFPRYSSVDENGPTSTTSVRHEPKNKQI